MCENRLNNESEEVSEEEVSEGAEVNSVSSEEKERNEEQERASENRKKLIVAIARPILFEITDKIFGKI